MNPIEALQTIDDLTVNGGMIEREQLARINQALRANAAKFNSAVAKGTVGHTTPTYSGGGEYGPLVPQSIQNVLNTVEFTEKNLKLWNKIPKTSTDSTVFEAVIETARSQFGVTPFMPEGDVPSVSEGTFEKKILKIRYLAEYIQVTDVSTLTGVIGFGGRERGVLATRQLQGTRALMAKVESELWHAQNAFYSTTGFDGIIKQITDNAAANVIDLQGEELQLGKVVDYLGYLQSGPNWASPNFFAAEPRLASHLSKQALAFGRTAMLPDGVTQVGNGLQFSAGFDGSVTLDPHPFLSPLQAIYGANAAAQGDAPPTMAATTPTLQASLAGSKFTGVWANKTFAYKIQARGDKGASIGTAVAGTFTPVSGGGVRIDIADSGAATSGDNSVRCYDLFRLDPGQTTYGYAGTYARNTSGGGGGTRIHDINDTIPHMGIAVLGQFSMETLYWVQLLDFLRRPLFSTKPVIPFLLMLFGSPLVLAPKKFVVVRNAKQSAATIS